MKEYRVTHGAEDVVQGKLNDLVSEGYSVTVLHANVAYKVDDGLKNHPILTILVAVALRMKKAREKADLMDGLELC